MAKLRLILNNGYQETYPNAQLSPEGVYIYHPPIDEPAGIPFPGGPRKFIPMYRIKEVEWLTNG